MRGNLAGEWRGGLREPLWLFTNLEPELALEVYRQRMKVEESFRDLKGLLGLGRLMNKKREQMEKMVALLLLAYSAGLLVGEKLREELYRGKKGALYSGLFILLKHKLPLSRRKLLLLLRQVWELWRRIVRGPVLSHG